MSLLTKLFGKKNSAAKEPNTIHRNVICTQKIEIGKGIQKFDGNETPKPTCSHIIVIGKTNKASDAYKKAEMALVGEIVNELNFSGRVNTYNSNDLPDANIEGSISGRLMMHLMMLGVGPVKEYIVEFCEKNGESFMIAYI